MPADQHPELKVVLLVLAAAAVIGALYGQWHAGRRIRAIHRKYFPDHSDGSSA